MTDFDVIVRRGKVLDGTGSPWFRADVALQGDRIAAMGDLKDVHGPNEIDAADCFVTPGFIEEHSHSDTTFFIDPMAQSAVRQGMTTMAVGLCGFSAAPIDTEHLERYQQTATGLAFEALPAIQWVIISDKDRVGHRRSRLRS